MRSIGRVEAPRWLSDESLKAAGARTSEPVEIFSRETDARHCQRPGTWQMRVHHDLSPFSLGGGWRIAVYRTECARTRPPTSLG